MPMPRMRAALSAALLSLGVLTALPAVSATAAPGQTFTNPIKPQKGADPHIVQDGGNYYMIATSWSSTLTMRTSKTLAGLATAPDVAVYHDTNTSRGCNMWAPELHKLAGPNGTRWYLYYTAGQCVQDYNITQRMHVLESVGTNPMGPYVYKNRLFDPNRDDWFIDGSVANLGGKLYLFGSIQAGGTQNLAVMPLSNPWTPSGPRTQISTPTLAWERQGHPVQEGPAILQRGGKTFMAYSASGCWTPDYKLGLLTWNGADPTRATSWVKSPNPVFQRNDANSVYGPGHNQFFTSPDGTETWNVYHANDAATDGCDNGRSLRAQRVTWNSDGTPNFGVPVRLGASLAGPSGETTTVSGVFTIVNRNSGKCLDVINASTADGANVRQWTCNGNNAQKWRFEDRYNEHSRIINVASGKVLDIANCQTGDGANVQQWTGLGNACQEFQPATAALGGWVHITNRNSGKVLDVENCSTADGANVRQWSRLGNACQHWQLRPA
ncbi:GH43 family beta-xylosidase [Kineococcus xinjiangensis]|uniref:GH43 family beta-xylosidase n=2 Tax=Kineococcus xinjiangensis TaxID=512762 RepID=A0A2S6IFZ7_9ACTN|nr:GH43 family beta-xylosidase [Kineococcus xinjiangensis]